MTNCSLRTCRSTKVPQVQQMVGSLSVRSNRLNKFIMRKNLTLGSGTNLVTVESCSLKICKNAIMKVPQCEQMLGTLIVRSSSLSKTRENNESTLRVSLLNFLFGPKRMHAALASTAKLLFLLQLLDNPHQTRSSQIREQYTFIIYTTLKHLCIYIVQSNKGRTQGSHYSDPLNTSIHP